MQLPLVFNLKENYFWQDGVWTTKTHLDFKYSFVLKALM